MSCDILADHWPGMEFTEQPSCPTTNKRLLTPDTDNLANKASMNGHADGSYGLKILPDDRDKYFTVEFSTCADQSLDTKNPLRSSGISRNRRNNDHNDKTNTQNARNKSASSAYTEKKPQPAVCHPKPFDDHVGLSAHTTRAAPNSMAMDSSKEETQCKSSSNSLSRRASDNKDKGLLRNGASLEDNTKFEDSLVHDAKSKKVGQYLLGSTIGEGSYGKVRVATHMISKQKVAIRVVTKKTLVLREAARRRFRREALLLQHVCHPNIVRLYEAMETSSSYYLVFELATGGNVLGHLSQRGRFTEEDCRPYMRQIISAVDHLHRSGIVHRDLKLENFLLDSDGNVKLIDFGLSAVCYNSDHHLSTQCGSPVYAAPELFAGRKYGKPIDVWSLGVCLFAMLTGRLPFLPRDETSLSQLYSLILKGCMIPGHLSPSCQNLLRRMLELNESRRITIEEMLSHYWLLYPDGQPIKRVPPVPKKYPENFVNQSIVKYMCTMYRFSESDVIQSVLERKLSASAATYNILKDGIETGRVTISFSKDRLSTERAMSSKKSPTTFSRLQNDTVDDNDYDCLESLRCTPRNASLQSSATSHHSKTSGQSQSAEKSQAAMNSYKSCILVLKRSRHHLRQRMPTNSHNRDSDYILVGKSAQSTGSRSSASEFDQHSSASENNQSPFVLPPITSDKDKHAEAINRKGISDDHGQKHYIYRDNAQSLDLDVKGVAPCVYDRNASLYSHSLWSHKPSFNSSYSSANNSPQISFVPHRTPPPPPPNSSFGNRSIHSNSSWKYYSIQSESPEDALQLSDHKQSHSQDFPSRLGSGHSASRQGDHARPSKEPIRPTLASLRDPFGRDTWNKSKAERRKRNQTTGVSDAIVNKHSITQKGALSGLDIDEHERTADLLADRSSFNGNKDAMLSTKNDYMGDGHHGNNEEIDSMNDPADLRSRQYSTPRNYHGNFPAHDELDQPYTEGETRKESPSLYRNDTDSPLSQSQEREEFMTPVTRVTITTIGRH